MPSRDLKSKSEILARKKTSATEKFVTAEKDLVKMTEKLSSLVRLLVAAESELTSSA